MLLFLLHSFWTTPRLYQVMYAVLVTILVGVRSYMYFKIHWGPFMFDFCYFANIMAITAALINPSPQFFTAAFILVNGPVLWAIVMWRNSMVFHSLDKMTSFSIHFLPALCTYAQRWYLGGAKEEPSLSLYLAIVLPLFFYGLWQVSYILTFDVYLVEAFKKDEELESALRWFTRKDKNSLLTQGALKISRKYGFFGPTEEFDSFSWKTKIVFYSFQLAYTLATFPLAWLSYLHPSIHAACLMVNFFVATNSGASFYLSSAFVKQRLVHVSDKLKNIPALQAAAEGIAAGATEGASTISSSSSSSSAAPPSVASSSTTVPTATPSLSSSPSNLSSSSSTAATAPTVLAAPDMVSSSSHNALALLRSRSLSTSASHTPLVGASSSSTIPSATPRMGPAAASSESLPTPASLEAAVLLINGLVDDDEDDDDEFEDDNQSDVTALSDISSAGSSPPLPDNSSSSSSSNNAKPSSPRRRTKVD